MPSKIQLDENLWFLYICLQNSDLKAIDFNAVGTATNLKPPAARMRYTRLRRQIENGTLIGTHGTPFTGGAEKVAQVLRKRKIPQCLSNSPAKRWNDGDEEEMKGKRGAVKVEREAGDEVGFAETEMESSESEEDSEDEMPLAKRRGIKFGGEGGGNARMSGMGSGIYQVPGGLGPAVVSPRVQDTGASRQASQPGFLTAGVGSGLGYGLGQGHSFAPVPHFEVRNRNWNFEQAQYHRSF